MTSLDYDLRYLQSGLENLEDYLLSDELYWPLDVKTLSGEPPMPQLTLGGLLLANGRAEARQQTFTQQSRLAKIHLEMDVVRSRWQYAWEKKAIHSFHSRLRMWQEYIAEYRQDPEAHADRYAYEVRLRVMLTLLQKEVNPIRLVETELLAGIDAVLKAVLIVGDFIWDKGIQQGFPAEPYWFLYGKLPEQIEP